MKKTISHLPQLKQDELKKIIEAIHATCNDVEKIILFGSYARGNYKEKKDLRENRKSGHVSDYDILVVTKQAITALNSSLWQTISNQCRSLNLSADPRIITHDITELNNKLAAGQYFYTDIKKEGIVIFDSKNFELAEKKNLTLQEKKAIAKEHFEHWFNRAESFLIDFVHGFERGDYGKAAFELHQSAEHAYKTILLVFTFYNPNEHFLAILGKECEKYFSQPIDLFAKNSDEEKERFKLLEYAYIGGRYDPKYKISKEDLEILASDVKKLLRLTEEICKAQIQVLEA
jgi:HEPN domain-containing protein/predicted nucleotidyltransferase